MKIKHLERATFVDYPGKIACTIFLYGCPFRCGFCYNDSLVTKDTLEDLSEMKILEFLEKRKEQLEGVCITGGEPLLSLEKEFLKKIKEKGYKIKLDTNGAFPEKLEELIKEKLIDYIAMDIKNSKQKYSKTVGLKVDLKKIEKSIQTISKLENYEFRTTIVESIHTPQDIAQMFEWIKNLIDKKIQNFSLQGFKNKGDFIDKRYQNHPETSKEYLNKLKLIGEPFCETILIKH